MIAEVVHLRIQRLGLLAGQELLAVVRDGLVVEATERPADDDPRRGAYYRLTPRGLRVLAAERTRLAALVAAIDALTPARRGPA